MAARQIRVRLDFSEPLFKQTFKTISETCWMLIDQNNIPNIRCLKENVRVRFLQNNQSKFDLYLQGGLIPDFESIHLLRDEDVIRLTPFQTKKSAKKRKHEEANDNEQSQSPDKEVDYSSQSSEVVEISKTESHKRSKKRSRQNIGDVYTTNEHYVQHTNQRNGPPMCDTSDQNADLITTKSETKDGNDITDSNTIEKNYVLHTNQDNISVAQNTSGLTTEQKELSSFDSSKNLSLSASGSGKKRNRNRKRRTRKVISPVIHTEVVTPQTSTLEKQEAKSLKNKHIHFSEDENVLENESQNGSEVSEKDLKVKPTILPPLSKKFEDMCQGLLYRAKNESQSNTSVILVASILVFPILI